MTHNIITWKNSFFFLSQVGGEDQASVAGTGPSDGVTSIVALEDEAAANERDEGERAEPQQDQQGKNIVESDIIIIYHCSEGWCVM